MCCVQGIDDEKLVGDANQKLRDAADRGKNKKCIGNWQAWEAPIDSDLPDTYGRNGIQTQSSAAVRQDDPCHDQFFNYVVDSKTK